MHTTLGKALISVTVFACVFFISIPVHADTSQTRRASVSKSHNWNFELHAGPSFPTSNFMNSLDMDTGTAIEGSMSFVKSPHIAMGLSLRWANHEIEFQGIELGDLTTFTVMPFLKLRPSPVSNVQPYGSLGIGANTNNFSESSFFQRGCRKAFGGRCELDFENTLAFKIAGGADVHLSKNLALNGEVGWLHNDGDVIGRFGSESGSMEFDASVVSLLLGFHYYW